MIKLNKISKSYNKVLLEDFSFEIEKGDFVIISGESGSGKSTLLNIIGLLEKPDSGFVEYDNIDAKVTRKSIRFLRRYFIGYLFQNYGLLENETVLYNLNLSRKFAEKKEHISLDDILKKLNLNSNILQHKVFELSGGEQQRLALARLLIKPCSLILADEPTGNLDKENSQIIMDYLVKLNNEGKTIVCVTHDEEFFSLGNKLIKLKK